MAESTPQVLEQQIADLQRQLDAARAEGGGDAGAPYERREVHTAVGEQIRQQVPSYNPGAAQQGAAPTGSDVPSYQDPALASQVQELVNVAFSHGVPEAIARAVKIGNTALIDALHDVLADELHQELLARQKVQPAA